jgi:hypothetical protein
MQIPKAFKIERIRQVLPASLKQSINEERQIQTILLRPANDNVKRTSVQSNGTHNIFSQARAIKSAVERLRHLLILSFFSSLGPR